MLNDLIMQITNVNNRLDKFNDTINNITNEISDIKNKMMDNEINMKNMKKEISFTNERIDYITKGNNKYTTMEQSSIYKNLNKKATKQNYEEQLVKN